MPEFYQLQLVPANPQRTYRQSRAMHLMAALFLWVYALPYLLQWPAEWMMALGVGLPALMIMGVALFKGSLLKEPHTNRVFRILETAFLLMGALHFLQLNQVGPSLLFAFLACVLVLIWWLESRIMQAQFVTFGDEIIEMELPLRTRRFAWKDLQAVMIRDEYLTLSFKDGYIRQWQFASSFDGEQEGDFLFYCQDHIRMHQDA